MLEVVVFVYWEDVEIVMDFDLVVIEFIRFEQDEVKKDYFEGEVVEFVGCGYGFGKQYFDLIQDGGQQYDEECVEDGFVDGVDFIDNDYKKQVNVFIYVESFWCNVVECMCQKFISQIGEYC